MSEAICGMSMNDCTWVVFSEPDFKTSHTLPQTCVEFRFDKNGKQNPMFIEGTNRTTIDNRRTCILRLCFVYANQNATEHPRTLRDKYDITSRQFNFLGV